MRHADIHGPHVLALLSAALAALLHGYEQLRFATEPSIGLFLWPMTPHLIMLFAGCLVRLRESAAAAIAVMLCFDFATHYSVFIAPTSSTAALAMIFVPLWNLLVFGPVTLLLAGAIQRA